ncbi:hypothetical protein ACX93W_04490 [Paenibacillus sp. CAU 1782]
MPNDKKAHPYTNPISEPGRYPIDLTAPQSHTLIIKPGVGSLSIGPSDLGTKADLHAVAAADLNWSVFEVFATPAGSPWPRYLNYTGSDTGFFEWAKSRPVEEMTWSPVLSTDTAVDATQSKFHGLNINLDQPGGQLSLRLPKECYRLSVSGDLLRFSATGDLPSMLVLAPYTSKRKNAEPFILPDLGELRHVTNLMLQNEPMAQPISLECISRFPNLTSLSLWGNFCDLGTLAVLEGLVNLELRFMPDLTYLPALDSWPLLDRFIAYNVEEDGGKQLKKQMKARAITRPWNDYASVSKLRKAEWWTSEYGQPFSSWPKRLAKVANEAYNLAQEALAQARSLAEAEVAITDFAKRFNALKGIETTEREDLGEAVWQLSQGDHLISEPIPEELAQRWFDSVRDY